MRRFNLNLDRLPPLPGNLKNQYCTLVECYRKSVDKVDIKAQPDEVVLNVFHQHWFVNVRWIVIAIFSFIFPIVFFPFISLHSFPLKYQIITVAFWYLLTGIYVFESFIDWFFDSYVITNQRVINIDFSNFINKKTSEASLSNIQDITARVSGLSQTIFNYGTVLIQTASASDVIIFKNIPNPERVANTLDGFRQFSKEYKGSVNGR